MSQLDTFTRCWLLLSVVCSFQFCLKRCQLNSQCLLLSKEVINFRMVERFTTHCGKCWVLTSVGRDAEGFGSESSLHFIMVANINSRLIVRLFCSMLPKAFRPFFCFFWIGHIRLNCRNWRFFIFKKRRQHSWGFLLKILVTDETVHPLIRNSFWYHVGNFLFLFELLI